MDGVLKGIKVIDLGTFITGPYAGMLLANSGANVIKIENPKGGDPFRSYKGGQYSPQFQAYNVNKRSITLNLKSERGKEIFLRLIKEADVLIENFRPGVMGAMGLDSDSLAKVNNKLIYCSITGYGPDGPLAGRPCYDTVAQSQSGYLSQFIDPKDPKITGPAVADALSGLFAANGILGALVQREKCGKGTKVDLSMVDAMIAFTAEPFASFFATGQVPTPHLRASISQSYVFRCIDGGLVSIHLASSEKFWNNLVECLGLEELLQDARFESHQERVRNFEMLRGQFQSVFCKYSRAHWLEQLPLYDIPHAAVATLDEVPNQEQVVHRKTFFRLSHPTEGEVTCVQTPLTYDGRRFDVNLPPPTIGEHTVEVLAEIGYSTPEIDTMRQNAVI